MSRSPPNAIARRRRVPHALRFDRFELRPAERLLLENGAPTELGARAFDVLLCLIAHRDRVVTKDEAILSVWSGRVVEENNLTVQVSALRKVIGAQAIATVPGRGYRFTVPVAEFGAALATDPPEIGRTTGLDATQQHILFTPLRSGNRLAYAISGSGYPIVRAPHWLTHLEADWQTPVWRPLLTDLSSRYTLVRFDQSGTGLSDPSTRPISLDSLVDELAAVVDAARLERFALLGMSQGGAVSIRYAARHPDRVSHLVLCGGYVRGTLTRSPDAKTSQMVDALCEIVRGGWGIESSAYRQIFTTQFFPGASREQIEGFNRLELLSSSPERAAQLIRAFSQIDASADLTAIRCPSLVFHTRQDARIDFEEGRFIAAGIDAARLMPLEGRNHFPLEGDAAYLRMLEAISAFLPTAGRGASRTP